MFLWGSEFNPNQPSERRHLTVTAESCIYQDTHKKTQHLHISLLNFLLHKGSIYRPSTQYTSQMYLSSPFPLSFRQFYCSHMFSTPWHHYSFWNPSGIFTLPLLKDCFINNIAKKQLFNATEKPWLSCSANTFSIKEQIHWFPELKAFTILCFIKCSSSSLHRVSRITTLCF